MCAVPVAYLDTPAGGAFPRDGALPLWGALLFVAATATAVAIRRVRRLTAVALAAGAALLAVAHGCPKTPFLGLALVVYIVAATATDRIAAAGLALAQTALAAGAALFVHGSGAGWTNAGATLIPDAVGLGAVWAIGVAVRKRRAYDRGLREQAEAAAEARLEQARHALVEERLRIAREMHDIVAHSMSLIAVQAELGGYVAAVRPEQAQPTLASIAATSRDGLRELRRLLGVLREADATADGHLHPPPGMRELDELLASTERAGVRVTVTTTGTPRPLPIGLDLSAYRIVQEALTNVIRHARTDRCEIHLTYGAAELAIQVSDLGRASDTPHAVGHGLAGMRERVNLCGGTLEAGPRADRGFRILARLPIDEPVAAA